MASVQETQASDFYVSKKLTSSFRLNKHGVKLLVAAIDFGTTYSGYAFSLIEEKEKISSNSWCAGSRSLMSLKTPTTLLLKPDKTFHAFGYEAEDAYSQLADDEEHTGYYYFRRFKMMLFGQSHLKRDIMLKTDQGLELEAITVFSLSINYLKDHLLATLEKRGTGVVNKDIQWVLTVPAIWNDTAKQFMREAAEKAGINRDNLMIALEPEAASLYCMTLNIDSLGTTQAQKGPVSPGLPIGTKYMVVDVGGGTVDITVHELVKAKTLKELNWASGGAWGGTQVDAAFINLIKKIIGNDVYDKFEKECTADLVDLQREFETKKRNIKLDATYAKDTFKVPVSLTELYEKMKNEKIKDALSKKADLKDLVIWSSDKLRIDTKLVRSWFDESCNTTVKHIQNLLKEKASEGTSTILLVGGFAESALLQESIRKSLPNLRLIIPAEAGLAVLKGAVLYGHEPLTIVSRIAKCSYGVRVYRDFIEGTHPPDKKITVGKKVKCKDVFAVHVKKGQTLVANEPQLSQRYTALEADQTSLVFDVYTSSEDNPMYVTDASCMYVGQLEVEVSGSAGKDRGVSVKMVYSGTEILVEAKDEKTHAVSKARFNFLD